MTQEQQLPQDRAPFPVPGEPKSVEKCLAELHAVAIPALPTLMLLIEIQFQLVNFI